ncbi:MAG TPA: proton-conducting transporter membrane subunit, partial [Oceanipulchritudo sp.]|nr:proton-conducting transporter membrane subunit [Oceanipulchritudo sp.]
MDLGNSILVGALILPWLAMALVQLGGTWSRGRGPGHLLWLVPAGISAVIIATVAGREPGTTEIIPLFSWVASQGVGFSLQVDGLSLFFGLVVSGMGTLIFLYTAGYFADKPEEFKKFYTYLLFFLAAMLGTVFSGNLLMLYIWWEMTGLASFFLIGYLHNDKTAREGARMALITTVSTGMALLAGILLVGLSAGTFEISELIILAPEHAGSTQWTAGFILILIGAFGKSAQFPFHYWLPNAMAAPTPVSAYLHSATMVKLGIFLIGRIFPIFRPLEAWEPILILVGFTTFLLGASFSLLSNKLKAILAYSTVSQLGFLVGFYGLSPAGGAHWDLLHIMNHVLYKGALFMVVGIIDHSTGIKDIRELGGLRRRMPLLFWITAISAASMAGVIGTTGFLSKEYMLKEKLDYLSDGIFLNAFPLTLVIVGSTIKMAFSVRFVFHVFLGPESRKAIAHFHAPSFLIQFPPLLLTALTVLFGLLPSLTTRVLEVFHVDGLHEPGSPPLKIWHGFLSPAFLISVSILLAGIVLYRLAEATRWRWAEIPGWARLDLAFTRGMNNLPAVAGRVTRCLGVEHPRYHVPVILTVALFWIGIPLLSSLGSLPLPAFGGDELLIAFLAAALLASAGACLLIVRSW